jgi:hypothetical protein
MNFLCITVGRRSDMFTPTYYFLLSPLIVATFILYAPIAKGDPLAVQCEIAGIPLGFDSIDLLSRKPQLGNGNVLVRCSNASSKLLKLSLIVDMSSNKAPNGEWALLQNGSNAMDLKIFVDPQLQQSLGTTGIPKRSLTHTQWIDGNSKITVSMPFFTQLTLSGVPAGGVHRSPADIRLTYRSDWPAKTD